ncbi:hypothetical protein AGDE_14617 [Angomonas deanei]|nr:hypothetical protein AGDE_14617 [Angomonas deanei]|eukprot:EPY20538.1 hypothetical protein AGDE_14617 [Angomonas deanei]
MGMKAPPVVVGGVQISSTGVVGWVSATAATYLYNYTAVAPTAVQDGNTITFFGHFDPAGRYMVSFGTSDVTCDSPAVVSKTVLQCTYKAPVGFTGDTFPYVRDEANGAYLSHDATAITAATLTLYPPAPVPEGVTGGCASDSKQCTSGSVLTFTIANADGTDLSRNRFTFSDPNVQCDITAVQGKTVTCTLKVTTTTSRAAASPSQVQFQTRTSGGQWGTPVTVGYLYLGSEGEGMRLTGSPSYTENIIRKSGTNTGAIAAAVVFAVLFLAAVIAIICILCCCVVSCRSRRRMDAAEPFYNSEMMGMPEGNKMDA